MDLCGWDYWGMSHVDGGRSGNGMVDKMMVGGGFVIGRQGGRCTMTIMWCSVGSFAARGCHFW